VERAKKIVEVYLKELPVDDVTGEKVYPEKTQIDEYDLIREVPKLSLSDDEFQKLCSMNINSDSSDSSALNCLDIDGPVLKEVFAALKAFDVSLAAQRKSTPIIRNPLVEPQESGNTEDAESYRLKLQNEKYYSLKQLTQSWKDKKDSHLPDALFDKVEAVVIESLRRDRWQAFQESEQYTKVKNFLWFADRLVVPDDFFTMRVLGRGGFGSVIGTYPPN
jgi:hypothetical protein